MLKDDLKCVLIGRNIDIYNDLVTLVKRIDATSRFKQVDVSELAIKDSLKKIQGPSLIFISDEVSFSLELLSDLIWQHNVDTIVIIVSKNAETVPIKELFNSTQFSRIKLDKNNPETTSILQLLIKSIQEKSEFKRCKKLLGISEKRCQWLVDSSREAVAFISRDMHLYANLSYLSLFEIDSVQKLRSITVKDLIVSDEHLLFDGFKKNQNKLKKNKHSIVVSMKKLNGASFRANAFLIPSVFKGNRCYQLWIQEINPLQASEKKTKLKQSTAEISGSDIVAKLKLEPQLSVSKEKNPFSDLLENTNKVISSGNDKKVNSRNRIVPNDDIDNSSKITTPVIIHDTNSLLKGIVRRKEARIISKQLILNKVNETNTVNHQILSLRVAAAQKKGIDDLLLDLPGYFSNQKRSVFWEKVKFFRLLQILIQRDELKINLFLRVNEASISDESFINWLISGLKRLGDKSKNLTFLIPSNINESEQRKTLLFMKTLKSYNCKIALDSFSTSKQALVLLKHSSPEYVRLSLPWTRQLEGNDAKEIRLSGVIRKLEANNIQVIAPCGFSKDMRRLFILSGASFCQ
ncbi:MAG: PAS domain-containing protein [Cocleimonas sp.]|jgi:PAS domain-containing protein